MTSQRFLFLMILVLATAFLGSSAPGLTPTTDALQREAARQTAAIEEGGRHWPVWETEFFTIHHQSDLAPDKTACLELDAFVVRTLNSLDPGGRTLADLRGNKLDYYLCDDGTVETLTGYPTRGMADLSGRSVISSHFPHFHELAHLLVYLLTDEKPALTHPLVQEGMACLLGGRWGRSPRTVLFTGWVHQNFGMGELADVLTREGFFSSEGGADVAYPLATILCEAIRREAGWSGVLDFNRRLSGSAEFVSSLSAADVESAVGAVCGWPEKNIGPYMETVVSAMWPEFRRCGISPAGKVPVTDPSWKISSSLGELKVWSGEEESVFQVVSDRFPVFILSPEQDNDRAGSSLFTEHLPEEKYLGQRYGLRCSPENIALYDYATNQLLATWVAGFTDETDGCGTSATGLVFEVDHDVGRGVKPLAITWESMVQPSQ
jgi:hypothetical protein